MSSETISVRLQDPLSTRVQEYIEDARITKADLLKRALEMYLESPEAHRNKGFQLTNKRVGDLLRLTHQQLDASLNYGLLDNQLEDLYKLIGEVPYDIKIQIFISAHTFFKNCMKNAKLTIPSEQGKWMRLLDKAIPVFDALVKSDEGRDLREQDHRYYSFLAYTLGYQATINYDLEYKSGTNEEILKKALSILKKAIEIREENDPNLEFRWYELKKAIFEIYLDKSFQEGTRTPLIKLTEIKGNIEIAVTSLDFLDDLFQKIYFHSSNNTVDLSDEARQSIKKFIHESTLTMDECYLLLNWIRTNEVDIQFRQ